MKNGVFWLVTFDVAAPALIFGRDARLATTER